MINTDESKRISWILFIFLFSFILPMDWFSPTGILLREFGAQPVNVLLLIFGLIISPSAFIVGWKQQKSYFYGNLFIIGFSMLLVGGVIGYLVSTIAWRYPNLDGKYPGTQFILQSALLVCLPFSIIIARSFFKNEWSINYLSKCMRWSAVIHIIFFLLDYYGAFGDSSYLFSLFRNGGYSLSIRHSGLFSEPSYFGLAISIYLPFIIMELDNGVGKNKLFWFFVSMLCVYCVFLSRSRTGMSNISLQAFMYSLWIRNRFIKSLLLLSFSFSLFVIIYKYFNIGSGNIDLSEIMRVGSTVLSINVALSGWMWSGIGIGQFHFFYIPHFAPHFLFLSKEAADYFNGFAHSRAHTFNLLTRVLVETGILGFTGWIILVLSILFPKVRFRSKFMIRDKYISLSVVSSFFLLLAQDFYLYLPFYTMVVVYGQSRLVSFDYLVKRNILYIK